LEAQTTFRNGDFAGAVAGYEQAVELDSLFALAWFRLSGAYGWLDDISSEAGGHAGERAVALMERLPARDRILVQASEAARIGDASFYDEIRGAVRLYPDDPDIWFELGEYIYHTGVEVGVASLDEAVQAFDRAIDLDPGFGPYRVHPLELTIAEGNRSDAEARLTRFREGSQDRRNLLEAELAIPLLLGDEVEFAQAIERSREVDLGILTRIRVSYTNRTDFYDRLRELQWANRDRAGVDHQWMLYSLFAEGALTRGDRLLDSLNLSASTKGLAMGWALGNWASAGDLPHASLAQPRTCEEPQVNPQCQLFVGWGLARSGDATAAAESARMLRREEANGSAFAGRAADVVEGTIHAAAGRVADARSLLGPQARGTGNAGELARLALGELEAAQGNITEAIGYLEGNLYSYTRFHVTRRLAQIHDQRGDTEQARAYYRSYLTITRAGEQDLSEVVEAREALARLGG